MKIWSSVAVAITVAGLAASPAVYAASSDIPSSAHILLVKSQTVKLSLRNDTGTNMELKVGDQVVSLDAGKTVAIKAQVGARIVVNAATSSHPAGELIAQVTAGLNNATVAIK